jgi:DNA invertase Pin-like site-specific DNA recombinase
MKLVGYLRVSTDVEAEKGLGLDVQERAIKAWAKREGHRIVLWARDEGISGSNGVETRVGLLDALAALVDQRQPESKRAGIAEGLVVYRLDRLARALTIQETTLATAWAMGASVFSVDLGEVAKDDPDDPMKTALRQMIGVFAQLERGMITVRLRSGRKLKAERGGYAGYGSPALGWRAEGRELVADDREQSTVARIAELHRGGASLREIAAALEAEGHRPKRSARWHPETIKRIVGRLEPA